MKPINAKNKNTPWTRFNSYLYKHWKLQALVIGLGLVTTPLALLNPYLTKLVIDKAYGNRDLKLFFILACLGGTVFIVNGLIGSLSGYLSQRLNRNVNFDMTGDFFRRLQNLSLSFYNNHSTGEYIYRIGSDVKAMSGFICNVIPQMITLVPRLIFILIVVVYLNWKLALFAALLVPITYVHPYVFSKWLKEIMGRQTLRAQNIFKKLQEVFSHIHLIKALGKEEYEAKQFEEALKKRVQVELKNAKMSQVSSFSGSLLARVVRGVIALYGGYQVIKGTMTLGSLTAVMIYITQFTGLLKSVGGLYQTIIVNSVTRQRLSEVLDAEPGIRDSDGALSFSIEKGKIEFRNVFFGYGKESLVLNGLNLSIEPGAKVALVGASGCGKTTILSLILRLYEQKNGVILIDGIDIRKIKLGFLRAGIGIALQEPFLWNDTVANNISYGAGEDISHEDVLKAAKLAEAHDFIMNFPDKYESVIGERACKISEGQKQRIAIARALIKKPKILILDEALSSVDSETEDKIMENIRREHISSTLIVVSHRPSTVRNMDLVYSLDPSTFTYANERI